MNFQTPFRLLLPLVLMVLGLVPQVTLAETCEEVCSGTAEGGKIESEDGTGGTITCCCLSENEDPPYTSHPTSECE